MVRMLLGNKSLFKSFKICLHSYQVTYLLVSRMATTLRDVLATTTGYEPNTTHYVTDGGIKAITFTDVMHTTTGYDANTDHYVTDGAINSSGLGDGGRPLLIDSGCLVINLSALVLNDGSENVISSATVNLFTRIKAAVLVPALFFIGFPTNCLNLLVFFKHGLKQRMNFCLFCLSLVDLLYIIVTFVKYVDQVGPGALSTSRFTIGPVFSFIVNNHLLGLIGFGWSSMFISAIISGERCFCVIWPLRSSTLLKTRTTAVVIVVGVVVIMGGGFAVTEKYLVICLYDVASPKEILLLTVSRYYIANKRLVDILDTVVYGMVVPITTCSVVTVATVVTAVKLKKVAQWRQESSSALSPREIALTRMLIYLSIQFIVLNLPNILLRVTMVFVPDLSSTGRFSHLFFLMTGVVEVCIALSSSLNFLVYYFAGTKYRETVHGLCRKATKKKAVYLDTAVSSVNTVS